MATVSFDTIAKIEKIICDALIYSPHIPMGVNILNIGQAEERESIIDNTNNIVVHYGGSNETQTKRMPPMYEGEHSFELYFNCQSYLGNSAHHFATYLMAAAKSTLTGLTPSIPGLQVEEPFVCRSQNPIGMSENKQYLYTQTWVLSFQEQIPFVSLDPCVQRGDCRYLFPSSKSLTRIPLAGVFEEATGKVYLPEYTGNNPDPNIPVTSGVRWSNPEALSGDWVFETDPETVFLEDPIGNKVKLVSTNSYTPDGRLSVIVKNSETDEVIEEVFYVDTGKKLARYILDLWSNPDPVANGKPISPNAKKVSSTTGTFMIGEFGVIRGSFAVLYQDPLNPNSTGNLTLNGGDLIGVLTDVYMQAGQSKYYMVSQSPRGKGWLKADAFELIETNSLYKLACPGC